MPWLALELGKIPGIAGVGQLVEIDHRLALSLDPVEHEIRSDETGAAGDQDHCERPCGEVGDFDLWNARRGFA